MRQASSLPSKDIGTRVPRSFLFARERFKSRLRQTQRHTASVRFWLTIYLFIRLPARKVTNFLVVGKPGKKNHGV